MGRNHQLEHNSIFLCFFVLVSHSFFLEVGCQICIKIFIIFLNSFLMRNWVIFWAVSLGSRYTCEQGDCWNAFCPDGCWNQCPRHPNRHPGEYPLEVWCFQICKNWGPNRIPNSGGFPWSFLGNPDLDLKILLVRHDDLLGGGNSNIVGIFTPKWFQLFLEFSPRELGKMNPILTHIFQLGWNHQLVYRKTSLPSGQMGSPFSEALLRAMLCLHCLVEQLGSQSLPLVGHVVLKLINHVLHGKCHKLLKGTRTVGCQFPLFTKLFNMFH